MVWIFPIFCDWLRFESAGLNENFLRLPPHRKFTEGLWRNLHCCAELLLADLGGCDLFVTRSGSKLDKRNILEFLNVWQLKLR